MVSRIELNIDRSGLARLTSKLLVAKVLPRPRNLLAGETNVRMRIPRISALGQGPPNPKTRRGLLDWGICRRMAPHRKTFEVKLRTAGMRA